MYPIEFDDSVIDFSIVLKFNKEKKLPKLERVWAIAETFHNAASQLDHNQVAIEEPFYSHGKSNPRHMGSVYMMFGILTYLLNTSGHKVIIVHNRTVKKLAGYKQGDKSTKDQMVKAYEDRVGRLPNHPAKYGRETLADSYFIALAGLETLKKK